MKTTPDVCTTDRPSCGGGELRLEPDSSIVELNAQLANKGRSLSGAPLTETIARRLTPRHPPGRVTRKARAYAAEILRLHEAGHTLAAIREALADVGIKVSCSTVWRETSRHSKASPSAATTAASTHG